ncbi:MAG: hypothetical protein IPO21_02720 [Bacteroidales bacterium]|nr:hypothetical protein [Bacteroidales bacterium]
MALYGDGYDSPLGSWTNNPIRPNNYFGIYNRVNPDGFKWYVHDFEHTMNTKNNETNIGVNNQWLITKTLTNLTTDFNFFNPYFIHLKLMKNEE